MNQVWSLKIDDYIAICKIAKSRGIKQGESIEAILFEYVNKKGIKPIGATELTKEEYIKEAISKNNSILSIESDNEETKYKSFIPKSIDKD